MREASTTESCPFCRIVAGEMPAQILHRDATVVAFRDLHPQAPTHILIVPVQHLWSFDDIREDDGGLLSHMAAVARRIARQEGVNVHGYRLVINTGPNAGQSVFHVHMHLLAGRQMRWPPG